jgi:hypothetical protein
MPATDFCHLIRETFTRTSHVPGPLFTARAAGAPLEVWASKGLVGLSRGFTVPGKASVRPHRARELLSSGKDVGLLDPRRGGKRPLTPLSLSWCKPSGRPSPPGWLGAETAKDRFHDGA